MTFTDDDLERLKERIGMRNIDTAMSVWPYGMWRLIARLEGAENALMSKCECVPIFLHKDSCEKPRNVETWLKAAGK